MDIEKSFVPRGFRVPGSQEEEKLCVLVSVNSNLHLYLIGVGGEGGLRFGQGRSGSAVPNLTIPLGDLLVCVADNYLHVFFMESVDKMGLGLHRREHRPEPYRRECSPASRPECSLASRFDAASFASFFGPGFELASEKTLSGPLFEVISYPKSYKRPKPYKIMMSSLAQMHNVKLEKAMLEETSQDLEPKSSLQVIPYHVEGHGTVMILFSTLIYSYSRSRDHVCDFEILDPRGVLSRKLPQLLIQPKSRQSQTLLLIHHSYSGISVSQEFAPTKPFTGERFRIISFGLNGSQFLVQTDFGIMFSLGLEWTNNEFNGSQFLVPTDFGIRLSFGLECTNKEWRVCEEGIEFQSPGMNFVTRNGFCIDTHGINDFRVKSKFWRPWTVFTEKYETKRCADFGISSMKERVCDDVDDITIYGGFCSFAVTLLDSYPNQINQICTACVSQVGVSGVEGSRKNLSCFLDVFRVDLHKLALEAKNEDSDEDEDEDEDEVEVEVEDGDEEEEEEEHEEKDHFVDHITSIQFDIPYNDYVLSASVVAMFPFYYH